MGIAIWLVPSPSDTFALKSIMRAPVPSNLSSSSGSYPSFEPHITLASFPSTTPVESIISAIPPASDIPRLQCKFASIVLGKVFFRSVYIAIRLTEDLAELHGKIHEKMGVEAKTPCFPHVSLCYVSDEDAVGGERSRYGERLWKESEMIEEFGEEEAVKLNLNGWKDGFVGSEIWVVRCEGPIEGWEPVEKIKLTEQRRVLPV